MQKKKVLGAKILIVGIALVILSLILVVTGKIDLLDRRNQTKLKPMQEISMTLNEELNLLEFSGKVIRMQVGDAARITPSNSAGGVTYEVMNTSFVTADGSGIITGTKVGKTWVRVQDSTTGIYGAVAVEVLPAGAVAMPKVETEDPFSIALRVDGSLWAWGYNANGQLGLGDTAARNVPTEVVVLDDETGEKVKFVDVESGKSLYTNPTYGYLVCYSIALDTEGRVWVWGSNSSGQLGNSNTSTNVLSPTLLVNANGEVIKNVIDIASGRCSNYILTKEGEVYGVGNNDNGQLGNGTTSSTTTLTKVLNLDNIIQIDVGSSSVYAIKADGTLWSFGNNGAGQLGNNTTANSSVAVQVLGGDQGGLYLQNVAEIRTENGIHDYSSENAHVMALTKGKEVYTWGYNAYGQLGDGTQGSKSVPTKILGAIEEIYVGDKSSYAKKTDGTMVAWGRNTYGELSTGDKVNKLVPTEMKDINGETLTNAFFATSSMGNDTGYGIIVSEDGEIYVIGYNANGQLGDGTILTRTELTSLSGPRLNIEDKTVRINVGETHQIDSLKIVYKNNLIYIEGKEILPENCTYEVMNDSFATVSGTGLITGTKVGKTWVRVQDSATGIYGGIILEVVPAEAVAIPKVETEDPFSIALRVDGSLWAWGANGNGQLGLGDTVTRKEPTEVVVLDEETGEKVKFVDVESGKSLYTNSAYGYLLCYSIALDTEGRVWVWGSNNSGQLGNSNTSTNVLSPTLLLNANGEALENVIDIASGRCSNYILTKEGEVYGVGNNDNGQLGNGTTTSTTTLTKVLNLDNIIQIDVGSSSVYAIKADGTVWSFGNNGAGQLGNNTTANSSVAVQVLGGEQGGLYLQNVAEIITENGIHDYSSENAHVMALTKEKDVYTWGYNAYGQLGDGTQVSKSVPTKVLGGIEEIYIGDKSSYAKKTDGTMVAWGRNTYKELSTGDAENKLEPTEMKDINGETLKNAFLATSSMGNGTGYGIIVSENGEMYVIGYNGSGQLGDGTTINRTILTPISSQSLIIEGKTVRINVGEQHQIDSLKTVYTNNLLYIEGVEISPENCTYEVMNNSFASVNESGVITGTKVGKTWVRMQNKETGMYGAVEVEVLPAGAVAIPKVEAENVFSAALKVDGSLWTWGENGSGQLGLGDRVTRKEPTEVAVIDEKTGEKVKFVDVESGNNELSSYNTIALDTEGRVWVWGNNAYGQLGNGTTVNTDVLVPTLLVDDNGEVVKNVIDIAAGRFSNYILTKEGEIYGIGLNDQGQLGNGTTTNTTTLTKVLNLDNVIQISVGSSSVYAIKADGTVWSFGNNGYGQLGNGTTTGSTVAMQVVGGDQGGLYLQNVAEIITENGYYRDEQVHVMALTKEKEVYTWGFNRYGQLGNGLIENKSLPTRILAEETIEEIYIGDKSSYAKKLDGTMLAWGRNTHKELSTGDATNKLEPTEMKDVNGEPLKNAIFVTSSSRVGSGVNDSYGIIVSEDGEIYVIGYNGQGQLGEGTLLTRTELTCLSSKSLNVEDKTVKLNVGDTHQIDSLRTVYNNNLLYLEGKDIAAEDCTYEVMNDSFASVSETGVITGTKVGKTWVRVKDKEIGIYGAVAVEVVPEGAVAMPKVEAESTFSAALKVDGSLWMWGSNGFGQLGLGDTVTRKEPTEVVVLDEKTGEKVKFVDVELGNNELGSYNTVALDTEGRVWVWGDNVYGQLGRADTGDVLVPTLLVDDNEEVIKNVIDIAAGRYSTHILTKEGEVYGVGLNDQGQLGNGTTTNTITLTKVLNLDNVIQISAGSSSMYAIKADGTLWSFGLNSVGQLGNNTTANSSVAVQVLGGDQGGLYLQNVAEIISENGHYYDEHIHVMALTKEKEVYTWGFNRYGQLGDETKVNKSLPTRVLEGEEIEEIYIGDKSSYAKKADGTMLAWGRNTFRELSTGDAVDKIVPTEMKDVNGEFLTNAIFVTSSSQMGRSNNDSYGIIVSEDGEIYVIGYNGQGQLGDETTLTRTVLTCLSSQSLNIEDKTVKLNVGETHQIESLRTVYNNNLLYLEGKEITPEDCTYEVMNDSFASVSETGVITGVKVGTTWVRVQDSTTGIYGAVAVEVVPIGAVAMPKVEAESTFSAALKVDGSLWMWGYNGNGQLGLGDTVTRKEPTEVVVLDEETGEKVKFVDVELGNNELGSYNTVALDTEGRVWLWGNNVYGQLGRADAGDVLVPTLLVNGNAEVIKNVIDIAAGRYSTHILTKEGEVYGVGLNDQGQLGNGTTTNTTTLTKVLNLDNVIEISVGSSSVYAIKADGTLWSFGLNSVGQLGNNTTTNSTVAVQVLGGDQGGLYLQNVAEIISENGRYYDEYIHVMALTKGKEVYTWGFNRYGQLGDGLTQNKSLPTRVLDEDTIEEIYIGDKSSYAKKTDGTMLAWGRNTYKELSTGDVANKLEPTEMKDINGETITNAFFVTSSSRVATYVNESYGIIVSENGEIYVIGHNGYGQLGDGTTLTRTELTCLSSQSLNIEDKTVKLNVGETHQIDSLRTVYNNNLLYLEGKDIAAEDCTYEVMNDSFASVSEAGVITGVKVGKTWVRVQDKATGIYGAVAVEVVPTGAVAMPKVEAESTFSAALKVDGSLWMWGYNGFGQLGLGDTVTRKEPTEVVVLDEETGEKVKFVDVELGNNELGSYSTRALDIEGRVWVWGDNTYGQLGKADAGDVLVPTLLLNDNGEVVKNVIDIAAGRHSTHILTKEGEVYGVGLNDQGQLGNGITSSTNTTLTKVLNLDNVIQISVGSSSVYAIKADGTLWSFGLNSVGQLGNGTTTNSTVAVQVLGGDQGGLYLENVAEVISENGRYYDEYIHVMALTKEKEVYTWGFNKYGQLGDGLTQNKSLPTRILAEEIIEEIYIGDKSSYAKKTDGTMLAWGRNTYKELSTGDAANKLEPTEMKDINGEPLTNTIFVTSSSVVATYVNESYGIIVSENGEIYVIGHNGYGQLGDGTTTTKTELYCLSSQELQVEEKLAKIRVNGNYQISGISLAKEFNLLYVGEGEIPAEDLTYEVMDEDIASVDETGLVTGLKAGKTWVKVTQKETGITGSVIIEVLEDGWTAIPKVGTGLLHTVALKADGTIWVWGDNDNGQLGLGDVLDRTEPTKVTVLEDVEGEQEVSEEVKFADIAVGYYHTMALDVEGRVWVWGDNANYQMGDNTNVDVLLPKLLTNAKGEIVTEVVEIAAGSNTNYMLTEESKVYAVGYGGNGEIGNGASGTVGRVEKVSRVLNIAGIAAARNTGYALKSDGTIQSWGYNGHGQLGIGSTTSNNVPQAVLGISNAGKVIAKNSGAYVMALEKTEEGNDLYAWGENGSSQIGNNTATNATSPVQILAGENVREAYAGYASSYAKLEDGSIVAWGHNGNGQLGIGNVAATRIPTSVVDIDSILDISANSTHMVYADEDGRVYTVGVGTNGQLGGGISPRTTLEQIGKDELTVSDNRIIINVDETHKIGDLSIQPGFNLISQGALTNLDYTFEVANENYASVDSEGVITGIEPGETWVKVTENTTGLTKAITLEVVHSGEYVLPKVESGNTHTIALKSDGTIWVWGRDDNGQLGLGNTVATNVIEPTKVTVMENEEEVKFVDIAVGYHHTLVLDNKGRVWACGYNGYGQLGDGTTTNSWIPKLLKDKDGNAIENIVSIGAEVYTSYALTNQGEVYAWGYNGYGQLGDGTTTTSYIPKKIAGMKNAAVIDAKYFNIQVVTADGNLFGTGYNGNYSLGIPDGQNKNIITKILEGQNVIDLEARSDGGFALLKTGEVLSWGYGGNGEIGNGANSTVTTPIKILEGQIVKEIYGGLNSSFAKLEDGTMLSWGYNGYGQLAVGDAASKNTPTQMVGEDGNELNNIIGVSVGGRDSGRFAVIVGEDGKIYTVGTGTNGQLGDETLVSRTILMQIGKDELVVSDNRIIINVGETHKIGDLSVTPGFSLLTKGELANPEYTFEVANENYASVNNEGVITGIEPGETWVKITETTTGLTEAVTVEVVHSGEYVFPKVESGNLHTVALKADGTIWAWGRDDNGQLGLGNTGATTVIRPTKITVMEDESEVKFVDVVVGYHHTLALDSAGRVWTWGYNGYGQLGDGTNSNSWIPKLLKDKDGNVIENIVSIGAAANTSYALTNQGEIYAWGFNGEGQLGDGTSAASTTPKKVAGIKNAAVIDAKISTLYVVNADGDLLGTGYNGYYSLGIPDGASRHVITKILGGQNIIDVEAKWHGGMALLKTGEVLTWGHGGHGDNGNGGTGTLTSPTKILDGQTVKEIYGGANNAFAKLEDGTMLAWGYNGYGQLAVGDTVSKTSPTQMLGVDGDELNNIIGISVGGVDSGRFAAIIGEDGNVYTVGVGTSGQLGDGKTVTRTVLDQIGKDIVFVEDGKEIESGKYTINFKSIGAAKQVQVRLKDFNVFSEKVRSIYIRNKTNGRRCRGG